MKLLIASTVTVMLLDGCVAKESNGVRGDAATTTTSTDASYTAAVPTTASAGAEPSVTDSVPTSTNENHEQGTWAGQIKVSQPVSMFNYVGAESGDFAPMRFRNDSEGGKKILAVCSNDDNCEFTGTVEWLDEPPPPDASAIGQIVRVDSVKRLPAETP